MRISTVEIKMLIKECVKTQGLYTVADLKNYIKNNSQKEVTRGQISGALYQLVDAKEIVRVERGMYSKDMEFVSGKNISSKNNEIEDTLKIEIYNALNKVEKELENVMGNINIWELNGDNFKIITKVRDLKETIEEIKLQCR